MVLLFNIYYACVLYRSSVCLFFCLSKNWNLNNLANLGWIGGKDISTESGWHAGHDYDVCACAPNQTHMIACMHTIFWNA